MDIIREFKEENLEKDIIGEVVTFADLMLGDDEFILPSPHVCEDGSIIEKVKIKEITGREEEQITKPSCMKNPGLMVTTLLEGVVRGIPKKEISKLLNGNRDFCFLASCLLSFGDENNEIKTAPKCGLEDCGKISKYLVCVPKLKVIRTGIKNGELIDGVYPRRGIRGCKKYKTILPYGEIQEIVGRKGKEVSMGEASTITQQRCVKSIDGVKALMESTFQDLGMKDRVGYLKHVGKYMSGVDLELNLKCLHCGNESLRLSAIDFFTLET